MLSIYIVYISVGHPNQHLCLPSHCILFIPLCLVPYWFPTIEGAQVVTIKLQNGPLPLGRNNSKSEHIVGEPAGDEFQSHSPQCTFLGAINNLYIICVGPRRDMVNICSINVYICIELYNVQNPFLTCINLFNSRNHMR